MLVNEWNNWKNIMKEDLNISLNVQKTSARHSNYINEIILGDRDFNKNKHLLKALKDINLKDIIKFYKDFILNSKNKSILKVISQKKV